MNLKLDYDKHTHVNIIEGWYKKKSSTIFDDKIFLVNKIIFI